MAASNTNKSQVWQLLLQGWKTSAFWLISAFPIAAMVIFEIDVNLMRKLWGICGVWVWVELWGIRFGWSQMSESRSRPLRDCNLEPRIARRKLLVHRLSAGYNRFWLYSDCLFLRQLCCQFLVYEGLYTIHFFSLRNTWILAIFVTQSHWNHSEQPRIFSPTSEDAMIIMSEEFDYKIHINECLKSLMLCVNYPRVTGNDFVPG